MNGMRSSVRRRYFDCEIERRVCVGLMYGVPQEKSAAQGLAFNGVIMHIRGR